MKNIIILICLSLLSVTEIKSENICSKELISLEDNSTRPKKSKTCKQKKRAYKKHGIQGLTNGTKSKRKIKKPKKRR